LQKGEIGIILEHNKPFSGSPMKIRPICTFPDPVLKAQAMEITDINGELQDLIDDMGATMYRAPGLGLAANQVGDLRRVIVFDVSPKDGPRDLQVIINPCITACEGELIHNEGCLSVLDFTADVRRSSRVCVSGVDRHGKPITVEAEDIKAVVLQHEIDHLDGVLFIDRISRLKRGLYLRRLKKQAENR
jgi:peptide deformylase